MLSNKADSDVSLHNNNHVFGSCFMNPFEFAVGSVMFLTAKCGNRLEWSREGEQVRRLGCVK